MVMLKFFINGAVVACALLSGFFWVKAAFAKVSAAPGSNAGVGFGGTPVNVQDHRGEVLDFLQTYKLQSKWNSWAALASAATAVFAALAFLLPG